MDPEVLLVDEVLAVGDQAFQNKCRDRIAALRKAGVTILLVSHDHQSVRELCDQAIWLEDGQVRAHGPTDAVVDAYGASVVAREEMRLAAERGVEAVVAEGSRERWGSGEVEIVGVDFLGPDGAVRAVLTTGEAATVRLRYLAHRRVDAPVFGLAIHRQDGVHVNGPNTAQAGFDLPFVDGPGAVCYHIERMPLLPGTYELSVAVYDRACSHPFDHHHRRFPFHVRSVDVREQFGVVSFPARWSHAPGAPELRVDQAAVTLSGGSQGAV